MLVNFVTKGTNTNLTALTSLPAGTEIGQIGVLTNIDTGVASIAPSTLLSVPSPVIILQGGARILLVWDGGRWLCAHPVPQFIYAQSDEVDDDIMVINRVTFHLDEAGDDLLIKVKYSDGTIATAAIAVTPDP